MIPAPARLTLTETIAGFVIKVLLGALYGYIYLHFYGGDDTWRHNANSLSETTLLLNDPAAFFTNEYTPRHALHEGRNSREVLTLYLNDLQYAILVKTVAILNLATGGNYYINSALLNIVFFLGHCWLFKILSGFFPEKRRLFYFICFFYLPAVFWLSGLRIDGLVFFFSMLYLYALTRSVMRMRLGVLLLSFIGIVICRAEVALLTIPASIAYVVSSRKKSLKPWIAVYITCAVLFFSSVMWMPGGGLTKMVARTQQSFLSLEGTRFPVGKLDEHPISYLRVLPEAFVNVFLRPAPWEAKGILQVLASLEIILFWLIVAGAIVARHEAWRTRLCNPVIMYMLVLGATIYLTVGYLVPFPGAIIRYKAMALVLMIGAIAALTKIRTN